METFPFSLSVGSDQVSFKARRGTFRTALADAFISLKAGGEGRLPTLRMELISGETRLLAPFRWDCATDAYDRSVKEFWRNREAVLETIKPEAPIETW